MAGSIPAFKAAGQQVQAMGRVQLSRETVSQSQGCRAAGEPAVQPWWGAAMHATFVGRHLGVTPVLTGPHSV